MGREMPGNVKCKAPVLQPLPHLGKSTLQLSLIFGWWDNASHSALINFMAALLPTPKCLCVFENSRNELSVRQGSENTGTMWELLLLHPEQGRTVKGC